MASNELNFVGKQIKIIDSKNKQFVGMTGCVVDETKNMFVLKTKDEQKMIMKSCVIIKTDDDSVFDGNALKGDLKSRFKIRRNKK